MRGVLLLLLLVASVAEGQDNRNRRTVGRNHGATGDVVLNFLPNIATAQECTGAAVTGTRGEAVTFARGSSAYCQTAGPVLTLLTSNQPRLESAGLFVERVSTNLAIRSAALENAAWTATNTTVLADVATAAPDASVTAESLQSTVNGGLVESTAAAISGTNGSVSVYVRTTAGTQAMAIRLRDTTAGADRCTGTLTATTTWQRATCSSTGLTTTNNHTVRIYAGGTGGTGSILAWGAQMEATPFPTSYVATAGTSVTRSAETALMVRPAGVTNAIGCIGATFLAVNILNVGSLRVLDFTGSNPLTSFTSTQIAGDDGATNVFATTTDMTNRAVHTTYNWSGTTQFATADSVIGTAAAYDGTVVSANLSIGAEEGGTTTQINGHVRNVKVGIRPGACR